MNNIVLVVAAHTDDEALGCGGTIARHVAEGDQVHAVFLADGVTSRIGSTSQDMDRRMAAANAAHKILGLRSVHCFSLPDNRLDSIPILDVVQKLEEVVRTITPNIVYTHHYGDLNVDHRVAHAAVLTACRPTPECTVKEIYAFEILSSTEWGGDEKKFMPQLYIDIEPYMETKMKAIGAYECELRDAPHSRSQENVKVLAIHRGFTSGVHYAEAFSIVRVIKKS